MPENHRARFTRWAALAVLPLLTVTIASVQQVSAQAQQAPAPPPPFQLPPEPKIAPTGTPAQTIDLLTPEGMATFRAQWKTVEAKIIEVPAAINAKPEFKTTYDLSPRADKAGFNDSSWPTIDASGLKVRRGGGKVSFLWFRTILTIPEKIGALDTAGGKPVLAVNVDDYAEVVINGVMPRKSGVLSPATIQGFGVTQRILLADSVKPGDKIELAILAMNGPFATTPIDVKFGEDNTGPPGFIFFRVASIEFFK